ncbi:MAG: redoxin domain-containing protein [Deltaproteobacteria bacterium]|nr:redoxin domain-containing protein [Deltaproteobacteria bacterium]
MTVTFKGQPIQILGNTVKVGDLVGSVRVKNVNFEDLDLQAFEHPVLLLISVPSLDTPVCDKEACHFDSLIEGNRIRRGISTIVVSKDLPFAQKRWASQGNCRNLSVLSDFPYGEVGKRFGIETSLGLLARTVIILGPKNEAGEREIKYIQIVPELTNEPDYEDVIERINKLWSEILPALSG